MSRLGNEPLGEGGSGVEQGSGRSARSPWFGGGWPPMLGRRTLRAHGWVRRPVGILNGSVDRRTERIARLIVPSLRCGRRTYDLVNRTPRPTRRASCRLLNHWVRAGKGPAPPCRAPRDPAADSALLQAGLMRGGVASVRSRACQREFRPSDRGASGLPVRLGDLFPARRSQRPHRNGPTRPPRRAVSRAGQQRLAS